MIVRPNVPGILTNRAIVAGAELDPVPANNSAAQITTVTSITSTGLVVEVLSPMTLNRQTGLFEQRVRLSNRGASPILAARISLRGLVPPIQLFNGAGVADQVPFVAYDLPVAAGESVDFLLEFNSPSRVVPSEPGYSAEAVVPSMPTSPGGRRLEIDRAVILPTGRLMIEFSAIKDGTYAIEYSADLQTWKLARPVIKAAANRVQWLDDGPPKTDAAPAGGAQRFYRITRISVP